MLTTIIPHSLNFLRINLFRLWDNFLSKGDCFMQLLSNVAERLKDLMSEADIKTPKLAEALSMEQSVISKFLRAERLPSINTLVLLADYFHCTTDYLLGESDVLDERIYKPRPPFHERLCFLLDHFHTTKYALSKKTNISEETISRWQKGIYEPNIESLIRLAKYFACSVDYILGRES